MNLFGVDLQMTGAMAIAVFFTIWWIVLFVTLPLGVRSLHETGEALGGADPGAPVAPQLGWKALLTTVLAIVVFAVLILVLNLTA